MTATQASNVPSDKTACRFLRCISAGMTAWRFAEGDPGNSAIELTSDAKAVKFSRKVVDWAMKNALCVQRGNDLYLTDEGQKKLKRLLHPESAFENQHREIGERRVSRTDGTTQTCSVNALESPLARLVTRRSRNGKPWLDQLQYQAGERLRADFERAGLQPSISANWGAAVAGRGRHCGGNDELAGFALDAKRRLEAALAAAGPDLSGVALDICCFLKGLETVESERGWPPRSAKLMLKTALNALVRHYGLAPRQSGGPLRHWGDDSYRPALG